MRERARLLVREETESERERLKFELSFFFLVCCDGLNFCVPEAAGDGAGDGATGRETETERELVREETESEREETEV